MNLAVREQRYLFEGTDHPDVIVHRVYENPSKDTFTIPSVKKLLHRYIENGKKWCDPFAGNYSPAEFTNDLNPHKKAKMHLTAENFCELIEGPLKGILFDPPYSPRQIKESYNAVGLDLHMRDTQAGFYNRVKNAICGKIVRNGFAISFGWTTEGFGVKRGFQLEEILIICHGGHHNDTLVTVERKL